MPHNGCRHQCSFCNQCSITGQLYQPTQEDVVCAIKTAINSLKENTKFAEIAFFGGSFTAIDREYMLSLLDATKPYIKHFKGIRISTRPDCIDDEILNILRDYGVTSIELGAQSLNDEVLISNDRGHSVADVYRASKLIKDKGFSLGLQMMTGLYKSTPQTDFDTARQIVSIKPDTVRVYPTITMKNTKLEKLYHHGEYVPQNLDEAVALCADILCLFNDNNISVIRLGLHHSDSLDTDMIAGPYHPSFRELCESKILFDKLISKLKENDVHGDCVVSVSPSCVSKLIGNNKSNIKRLNKLGYNVKIIQDNSVGEMDVVLK